MIIVFSVLLLVLIVCVVLGVWVGKNRDYLKNHLWIVKAFLFGFIVFAGCFVFPISSDRFPFDLGRAYRLIIPYGIIGWAYTEIYGKHNGKRVYGMTLLLTIAGMLCRYLLEYGEVSNTYNFTPFNIVSYLALIPAFTTLAYYCFSKGWMQEKRNKK